MKKFVFGALLIVVTLFAFSCRQAKESHHAQSPLEFMKELRSEQNADFSEFDGIASLFVGQEAMVDSILSSPELIDSISLKLGAEFGFEPTEEDKDYSYLYNILYIKNGDEYCTFINTHCVQLSLLDHFPTELKLQRYAKHLALWKDLLKV